MMIYINIFVQELRGGVRTARACGSQAVANVPGRCLPAMTRSVREWRLQTTKEYRDNTSLQRVRSLVDRGGSDRACPRGARVCPTA